MENSDLEHKQQIIEEITNLIMAKGKELQHNSSLTPEEQLVQVDVLLDTVHFLHDYDENVKVLNKYWLQKNWEKKFKDSKANERDN